MSSLTSGPFSRELIMGASTNEFGALGIHSLLYSVRAADSVCDAPAFWWDLSYPPYSRVKVTGLSG